MKTSQVAYVAVMGGVSAETVAEIMKGCGLSVDNPLEAEGVTFFMQKADAVDVPEGDNIVMATLEDGIMLGIELPKDTAIGTPVAKGDLSYGEALGKFGVYPMMNVAIDVLRTALSRCTDRYCEGDGQKDPAEVQTQAAAIIADFGNYVAEIISLMPVAALKMDKEISMTGSVDLYEEFIKGANEDFVEPAKPSAEGAAAAAAAPAAEGAVAEGAAAATAVEKGDTNSAAAPGDTKPAGAADATVQNNNQEQPGAQATGQADATALLKSVTDQMTAMLAPLTTGMQGLTAKVESLVADIGSVSARVEKAEKTLDGTVVGGRTSADPVRKSDSTPVNDSFNFDTGMGRPIQ